MFSSFSTHFISVTPGLFELTNKRSLTRVNINRSYACLALNLATPPELAHTPLFDGGLHRVIPATATQQVAAVHVHWSPVTHAPVGPQGADGEVLHAVVGRLFGVHQVAGGGEPEARVPELKAAAAVHPDFRGTVVFVSDVVS